ncbi:UbiA family prenyltransferase [Streptomyces sp. NPDC049813]|uniref:UbiA family prenyltransferase n=1 Tax=Streptomyces sp. NPDC049813 TaxID=3365597 RepID=UPI003797B93E
MSEERPPAAAATQPASEGRQPATTRPALRAWAELLRLPALFTVPGDALAGAAAAGARPGRGTALALSSSLCLYEAGMALNDWADRDEDAVDRPHRPIPSGRIRPGAALAAAGAFTAAGLGLAFAAGRTAGTLGTALAATVWAYDLGLKRTPAGPLAMGAARGLDLLMGAAASHDAAVRSGGRDSGAPGRGTGPLRGVSGWLGARAGRDAGSLRRAGGLPGAAGRVVRPLLRASGPLGVADRVVAPLRRAGGPLGVADRVVRPLRRAGGPLGVADRVVRPLRRAGGPLGVADRVVRPLRRAGGPLGVADRVVRPLRRASGPLGAPARDNGPLRSALPSALVLATHTTAVTTVSRNETTGGAPAAPAAALATTAVLTGHLLRLPAGRGAAAPLGLPGPTAYAGTTLVPLFHAVLNPSPPLTQRAVGAGIRAMIPLQAALTARAGAPRTALATAALAPLARRFAKKVSVT